MSSPTLTTGAVAHLLNAELVGPASIELTHFEGLDRAGAGGLSFIRSPEFARGWAASKASAALVTRGIEVPGHQPESRALIFVPDADLALASLLEKMTPKPTLPPAGAHRSAVIDPSATVSPTARIGPLCSVGPGAVIADDVVLLDRVSIGEGARIGRGTFLHPGVVVYPRCSIGASCILHANVVVGADGFGYRPSPDGRGVVKIPHLGIVEIHDHVEIGAGTCIDRAKFGSTVIGAGSKLDNLVQVAHNCRIGRSVVIAAGTCLAGSVILEDGVQMGGNCSISDATRIGAGARIGGATAIMRDIPPRGTALGNPSSTGREFFRYHATVQQLSEWWPELRDLARERRTSGPGRSGRTPENPENKG
jgi:UDP-3-O-[3-hydroxymyristoyl] glucosamine N-acyltransferase